MSKTTDLVCPNCGLHTVEQADNDVSVKGEPDYNYSCYNCWYSW